MGTDQHTKLHNIFGKRQKKIKQKGGGQTI